MNKMICLLKHTFISESKDNRNLNRKMPLKLNPLFICKK